MRNAVYISASLHVAAIALVYFGLPSMFDPDPVRDQPVLVELVTLEDKPATKSPPAKPQPPPPPPRNTRKTAALTPLPPEPPPPERVQPPPEPVPIVVPEPKPKAKPVPKPRPKPKIKVAKAAPKPKQKPKPPPDAFQMLLKNLSKQAEQSRTRQREKEAERKKPNLMEEIAALRPQPKPVSLIDQRRLVATLAQLVIAQITPCWSIPVGAKDAAKMRVGITIFLSPDGTLRGLPLIEDQARVARDPFYRAVAESALRALRDPRCTPLRLPLKNYETWKEISFNFDPREVLGQ